MTGLSLETWGSAECPHCTARKNGRNDTVLGLLAHTPFVTLKIGEPAWWSNTVTVNSYISGGPDELAGIEGVAYCLRGMFPESRGSEARVLIYQTPVPGQSAYQNQRANGWRREVLPLPFTSPASACGPWMNQISLPSNTYTMLRCLQRHWGGGGILTHELSEARLSCSCISS